MKKISEEIKVVNQEGLDEEIAKEVMITKSKRGRKKKEVVPNEIELNKEESLKEESLVESAEEIKDKEESLKNTEVGEVNKKEEDIKEENPTNEEQVNEENEVVDESNAEDHDDEGDNIVDSENDTNNIIVDNNEEEASEDNEDTDNEDSENTDNKNSKDEDVSEVYKMIDKLDRLKLSRIEWFKAIPKKYQLQPGDIVYNYEMDRFGVFVSPSYKDGLARTRLFKIASKTQVYVRDWFINYDALILVKRKGKVRSEFIETEDEFARRAGKTIRAVDTTVLREVAISRIITKKLEG